MLKFAKLMYSKSCYDVEPNDTLPMPKEFDFSNPIECAKKIFAIMSNASGGNRLYRCKVSIHTDRKTANLTAFGVHVYYKPENSKLMTAEEAIAAMEKTIIHYLGSVTTDQYGDGWQRAVWRDVIEDTLSGKYGVGLLDAPAEAIIWAAEQITDIPFAKEEIKRVNRIRVGKTRKTPDLHSSWPQTFLKQSRVSIKIKP